MIPINNDMMRATRRFDAAGRPMTRDIAHRMAWQGQRRPAAQRLRDWAANTLPDLTRPGGDAMPHRGLTDSLRAPLGAVWAGLTMFLR